MAAILNQNNSGSDQCMNDNKHVNILEPREKTSEVDGASQNQPDQLESESESDGPADEGKTIEDPHEKRRAYADTNININNAQQIDVPYSIFRNWEKYSITIICSLLAFFSSLSVPIYLPALPELEKDFNIDTEMVNLTVVVYTLFQGIAPSFWSPAADQFGRRPVYLACILVYMAACIGFAEAHNFGTLIGVRIVQAMGMAATVAIGAGVVGDITQRKERGSYVSMFSGITLIGSAIGPLIGGGLSTTYGWRAIFWFLTIASGVAFVVVLLITPETCRSIVGNGIVKPRYLINQAPIMVLRGKLYPGEKQISDEQGRELGLLAPRKKINMWLTWQLVFKLDVALVLTPCALHYVVWLMVITSQTTLLTNNYHFTTLQVGLSYLANGIGSVGGSLISGKIMDLSYQRNFTKFKADWIERYGPDLPIDVTKFDIRSARLWPAPYISTMVIVGTIIFGWTIQYKVHWIVPILMTLFSSAGTIFYMNLGTCLMVDLYPAEGSSATAALNVVRCILGAAGIAAVDKMITSMGAGGAYTLLSGFLFLSWTCIVIVMRQGRRQSLKSLEAMAV